MPIYLGLLFLAFSGLTTSTASALHGGNYLGKVYVVAVHCILLPTVAPFFWLFCRRGKQAKAELNYISKKGSLAAVKHAYPLGIGYAVAPVIAWCSRHPSPHLKPSSARLQQEICGGFFIGVLLGLPTMAAIIFLV